MADLRPSTKAYPSAARKQLGLAVTRAREAAGFPYRPAFAKAAGVSVRSILKLEQGDPVGAPIYEAAARALPGWNEGTPRLILEGGAPPVTDSVETPGDAPSQPGEGEPNPADYPDELEYLNAVYWFLRKSMSHEAVMRGFNMAAAIYARRNAERDSSSPHGDNLGRSS
jgi:transcriptional regulator with XRE-family HTH domain